MKFIKYAQLVKIWIPGRTLMGLDVGTKFIGVAVSDEGCYLSFPVKTIRRDGYNNIPSVSSDLSKIIRKHHVQCAVLGVPTSEVEKQERIIEYMSAVWDHGKLAIPVVLQDESYSTMQVLEEITGTKGKMVSGTLLRNQVKKMSNYEKALTDQMSAMNILDRGLKVLRNYIDFDGKLKSRK